jgi:hypothetical protein
MSYQSELIFMVAMTAPGCSPQFRVADIFCQPREVLCSSSSGLVLWVRFFKLIQNAGRKAVINNVISQETKVPGSLNVIAKFYGAADR